MLNFTRAKCLKSCGNQRFIGSLTSEPRYQSRYCEQAGPVQTPEYQKKEEKKTCSFCFSYCFGLITRNEVFCLRPVSYSLVHVYRTRSRLLTLRSRNQLVDVCASCPHIRLLKKPILIDDFGSIVSELNYDCEISQGWRVFGISNLTNAAISDGFQHNNLLFQKPQSS